MFRIERAARRSAPPPPAARAGPSRRRSSANASAAAGIGPLRPSRRPSATPCSVPEPRSTTSAHARSRPIDEAVGLALAATSRFERLERIATTPSSVSTKFAYEAGLGARPSGPPYSRSSSSGRSKAGRPGRSSRSSSGFTRAGTSVEEVPPQVRVLRRSRRARTSSRSASPPRDAAHLRAEVRGLEVDGDAVRRDQLDERVRDLLAEPLLHREPAGVELDEARQLRDADDLGAGDVGDVRGAEERQRMVLAQAVERDRTLDDLADEAPSASPRPLGRERRQQLRVAVVAGGRVVERPQEPLRRLAACRACPAPCRAR